VSDVEEDYWAYLKKSFSMYTGCLEMVGRKAGDKQYRQNFVRYLLLVGSRRKFMDVITMDHRRRLGNGKQAQQTQDFVHLLIFRIGNIKSSDFSAIMLVYFLIAVIFKTPASQSLPLACSEAESMSPS
jgi:hypothetical protein